MKTVYKEKRFNNFREIINTSAEKYSNRPAFYLRLPNGGFEEITYGQLRERYYRLCTFLLDAGLSGKRIAVMGKNCCEWALSYLCAATVGVAVPIDKELSGDEVENFLEDANCAAVCTDGKVRLVEKKDRLIIDFKSVEKISAGLFYNVGKFNGENYQINEEAINTIEITKNKMQVLIFTSGTTGNSKGVCLSQHAICSDIFSTVSIVKIKPNDRTLSILPLHHTYECTLNCLLVLSKGACISYADSLHKIAVNMLERQPSILVVVPDLLRFMATRIKSSVATGCPKKYKYLFLKYSFAEAMNQLPFPIRHIIRSKVRKTLGGKLRLFIVGAADLDTSLVKDFAALGIRTLQGYGLTECAPLLAGNNDFYFNANSTGVAIPGVSLKIDMPNANGIGEILAKGDNIMLGYFNDPESTKAVFREGWFCTGDLGRVGDDGELYITGRLKNVIVTENGKNIYPEELETRLSACAEIGEVLVVPAKKREKVCIKAKILPNFDFLKEHLGHSPTHEEAKAIIQKSVDTLNNKIPPYKNISVVEVLTDALHKTTTQKIKRYGENMV